MKPINISISKRLVEARNFFGYSQYEIAPILGIGRSTYANWGINRQLIPFKHLYSLANHYNTSLNYLLGLTNDPINNIEPKNLDKHIISNRLNIVIRDNNLSVSKFSESLNVSDSSMYEYLKDCKLIPTYIIYDIARKYNISIDWLVGKSDKKYL